MRPSAEAFKEKNGDNLVNILEVGVWNGKNAQDLLAGMNCHWMYLLDSWHDEYQGYNFPGAHDRAMEVFKKFDKDSRVVIIRADSIKFPLFPRNYFDYIYLDGDHSYAHVINELAKYWWCLKSGGMISGDNYEMDGVQKAVKEFRDVNHRFEETKPWKKAADGVTDVLDWWMWK